MQKGNVTGDPVPADGTARIRRLVRQLRILHERLNRIEEFAYTILAVLEEQVEEAAHDAAPVSATGASARSGVDRVALRRMAESGAVTVKIERHADLSASVRIDAREPFPLSPMLADLLEILSRDGGRITDEKVGWKTREEVLVLLSKKSERDITGHALTHAIYRLRGELESRGGVNPFLLQTTRSGWMRFAVLRAEPADPRSTFPDRSEQIRDRGGAHGASVGKA